MRKLWNIKINKNVSFKRVTQTTGKIVNYNEYTRPLRLIRLHSVIVGNIFMEKLTTSFIETDDILGFVLKLN